MGNKGNPYKVGLFLIVTTGLLVATLLALGVMKYFHDTVEFMTVIDGSVQGLDKGAKVKLSGVTVGQVVKIQIGGAGDKINEVYVFMEFDPDAFTPHYSIKPTDVKLPTQEMHHVFYVKTEKFIEQGLRCQLKYGDITGSMFVEITFVNPAEFPVRKRHLPEGHPLCIPSIPSASIGNVIVDFQNAVLKISKIDFERLSSQLGTFLDAANGFARSDKTHKMVEDARAICDSLLEVTNSVKDTWTRQRLEEFNTRFNGALSNVDRAMSDITRFTKDTGDEIKKARLDEAAKKFTGVLDESREPLSKLNALEDDLRQATRDLEATLRSGKDLLDHLERQPDSILYGNSGKPVVPHR